MRHIAPRSSDTGSIALVRVGIGALLVALAGCGAAQTARQPPKSPSPSTLAVLRAPRTADDAVPSWVARFLTKNGEPMLSTEDLEDARRVLANQQGWLVPAPENELCLALVVDPLVPEVNGQRLYPSVKRSCVTRAEVEQGRLAETLSLIPNFAKRIPTRVTGIVPDGVSEVTIRGASATAKVTVIRNAYEDILINPSSVSFTATTDGHRQHYVVPLASAAGTSPAPYHAGPAAHL